MSNKMQGDIHVFSDGKNGSTFRFTMSLLPIQVHKNMSTDEMLELRKRDLGINSSSKMHRNSRSRNALLASPKGPSLLASPKGPSLLISRQ